MPELPHDPHAGDVVTDNTTLVLTDHDVEDHIAAERNTTRRKALDLIRDGQPGRAEYELGRSVMRQARMAGLGSIELPVFGTGADL